MVESCTEYVIGPVCLRVNLCKYIIGRRSKYLKRQVSEFVFLTINIQIRVVFRNTDNDVTARVRFSKSGIIVDNNGMTISLDPSRSNHCCDWTFVSHAHTDHFVRRHRQIISTIRPLCQKQLH